MPYILFAIAIFLSACSVNGDSFDVKTATGERIIGHCVTDASSVEAIAYQGRKSNLEKATVETSLISGFRFVSVLKQDYRYDLYTPTQPGNIEYHVACPWKRTNEDCVVAGRFQNGNFEAYTSFKSGRHAEEAAKAAFRACTGNDG